MDLVTQKRLLEIMTDWAKRSFFTLSVSSLWGYQAVYVCGERGHASEAPQTPSVPEGIVPSECPARHMINLGTGDQSEGGHSLHSGRVFK